MRSAGARRLLIVGLAGVVLAAALFARRDEGTGTGAAVPGDGTAAAAAAGDGMPVVDVRLELLEASRAEFDEAERNPFRFEARTPEPAPDLPPPVREMPSAPPVATGPPPPPPIPLRFIGLVDAPTQAGRVAVLSDGRGNVFHGREGDIIEGRYRLVRIGADSAELAYLDGRGRQTIRLSGQ